MLDVESGETSIFIGNEIPGTEIRGITLSDKQLKKARNKASRLGLKKIVFSKQNYSNTNFDSNFFDGIFGIESICYCENNMDFLHEAYRILKIGGKLVVSDGFLLRSNLSKDEQGVLDRSLLGWGVPNLSTVNEFSKK